ncbi:unnamed protein product [Phytophthora fragariaefolia]|uniref:Unnamed protein product n=1 Tax=Phytophthora fragariaefolia TaxID=1490495 RepID=A0A9W6XUB6_9STRA|nr:unnamed protein product [Phytophthora fragariaefolia]
MQAKGRGTDDKGGSWIQVVGSLDPRLKLDLDIQWIRFTAWPGDPSLLKTQDPAIGSGKHKKGRHAKARDTLQGNPGPEPDPEYWIHGPPQIQIGKLLDLGIIPRLDPAISQILLIPLHHSAEVFIARVTGLKLYPDSPAPDQMAQGNTTHVELVTKINFNSDGDDTTDQRVASGSQGTEGNMTDHERPTPKKRARATGKQQAGQDDKKARSLASKQDKLP